MKSIHVAASCFLASCLLLAPAAPANERHFTYTYETAVLPPDSRELEVWTTWRAGRDRYYSAIDNRLELEIGLTERLMTAFYLNFGAVTLETEFGRRESTFAHRGVSSEWKYQLSRPESDIVGLALYGELGMSTSGYAIEGKLLFDKWLGPFLLALNLVGELEWEVQETSIEREIELAPVAAAMWLPVSGFGVGLELRSHNEIVDGELEHSALHAGPVIAYARWGWWAALTVLPQIAAPHSGHAGGNLILDEHERIEVRLLLGLKL